ncbi:cytochrome P450 [Lyophyllum atratum]|nr:cytochrome P450 [Lyophyllum atratum]
MGLSVTLLAASIVVFVALKIKFFRKGLPLPPGPPADPILGHVRLLPSAGQDVFFYNLGKIYGDVLHFSIFGRPMIVLNSVNAAIELLDKRSANYSDRPNFPIYETMGLHDSLVFVRYGNDLPREARLLAENVLAHPERRGDLLIRFATAIVVEIAYGHQIVSDDDPYVKIAEDVCIATANSGPPGGTPLEHAVRYFPSWFPGAYYAGYARKTWHLVRKLYDYPVECVTEEMAKGDAKPSFLATQLEALQREGRQNPATIEQIKAAAGVLYIAGAETTSSTLAFFFLAMVLYPECQTKAQEEIDAVVGRDRLPEFHDREQLPYVECLLQETLRWNHAVPLGVPHRSLEDDVYDGMFIPKGSIIIANTRGMSLDENVYADASAFEPTRFLPSPLGRGEPYPVGPFGFGRRACPGRHVANDSLWIAIVTILSAMHISKEFGDDGKEIVPDETPVAAGITRSCASSFHHESVKANADPPEATHNHSHAVSGLENTFPAVLTPPWPSSEFTEKYELTPNWTDKTNMKSQPAIVKAAEQCKALLMEMREASSRRELAEHEAEVDKEQRSLAKSARLDDLFRDLKHIEEGLQDIREQEPPSDGHTLSHAGINDITRVVEENHQAQVAQLVAVMEDCSACHRRQQTELLKNSRPKG